MRLPALLAVRSPALLAMLGAACAGNLLTAALPASGDPAPPAETTTPCPEFLAASPIEQLRQIEVLLAYDALGFDSYPSRTSARQTASLRAARVARERCAEKPSQTVYRALGGTTPRAPYGITPEGGN